MCCDFLKVVDDAFAASRHRLVPNFKLNPTGIRWLRIQLQVYRVAHKNNPYIIIYKSFFLPKKLIFSSNLSEKESAA